MCVGFWSLEHPDYALYVLTLMGVLEDVLTGCCPRVRRILCSNRDEYLSRPTTAAHFHSFGNIESDVTSDRTVLSGRDLRAGGTWLGVSLAGRAAFLYAALYQA